MGSALRLPGKLREDFTRKELPSWSWKNGCEFARPQKDFAMCTKAPGSWLCGVGRTPSRTHGESGPYHNTSGPGRQAGFILQPKNFLKGSEQKGDYLDFLATGSFGIHVN